MFRPFKDLNEFKKETGLDVGSIVTLWYIDNHDNLSKSIITNIDDYTKTITFGKKELTLSDLCSDYEYNKNNKWCAFGVEENLRPAKFKVGHKYKDADEDSVFMVTAKYKSPLDNKLYLITNQLEKYSAGGPCIDLINKDENEDEFINRRTRKWKEVECSAKDEVKE